ncbi:MAG: bifunctional glutamate N-acetyltransferase/amino-acid acetyltransferase ArgJ [Planctomycetota bacterium]
MPSTICNGKNMSALNDGSILSPAGFMIGSASCGIKSSGNPDIALLVAREPCSAAGTYTRNRFAAAPVQWCRSLLPSDNMRAIAVNAGNANACTGERGVRDVQKSASLIADLLDCHAEQVGVASTGVIGKPLPMNKLDDGFRRAHASLTADKTGARKAERAILTTDTVPKAGAVEVSINGRTCRIGGMAKGSGMINPDMATMLAFITTDAAMRPETLQRLLRAACERSFNRITVDGDTSTNDTVLAMANGVTGIHITDSSDAEKSFMQGLRTLTTHLARAIAKDGEGATKLIEIKITGARDESDAERTARAVANSPLVKCAVHGEDPNWGRIVCAAGYGGAEFDPASLSLSLGGTRVFEDGLPTGEDARAAFTGESVCIRLDLGAGDARTTVWTCDLSEEYIKINSEYHT